MYNQFVLNDPQTNIIKAIKNMADNYSEIYGIKTINIIVPNEKSYTVRIYKHFLLEYN